MEQKLNFDGRVFTTTDVANSLGISNDKVVYIAYRLDVGITESKGGLHKVYNHAEYVRIKNYYLTHKQETNVGVKSEKPKMSLEEMKKLHPLVTDERCFKLSWFPETKPNCMEDVVSW